MLERKGGHGMLPFFASSHEGKWAEKNNLHHRGGGGDKKIFREKNKPVNCERSLSSLLDGIMNKEIFIRTVNLILFTIFFSMESQQRKKEKRQGKVLK